MKLRRRRSCYAQMRQRGVIAKIAPVIRSDVAKIQSSSSLLGLDERFEVHEAHEAAHLRSFSAPAFSAVFSRPEVEVSEPETETTPELIRPKVDDRLDPSMLRLIRSLPPAPVAQIPALPAKSPADSRTHTLVLDVDETLLHCSLLPLEGATFVMDLKMPSRRHPETVYVRLRPHLKEFLAEANRLFEVVVFTAGHKAYASALLKKLDPDGSVFKHRLYRDDCYIKDGRYIKNLNILGRDLDRTVIVDNSLESFGFQPGHGLLIPSFYEDDDDHHLMRTLDLLKGLLRSGQSVPRYLSENVGLAEKIRATPPK